MKTLILFLSLSILSFADPIIGYWMTQEGKTGKEAVVYIEKDKNSYSGKIKYIATVDKNFNIISFTNKDELIDFELVKGFKKIDKTTYKNGRIIDPKTSKEYYASAKVEGKNLILRGSLDSYGIFGAKRVWKKIGDKDDGIQKKTISK